MARTLIDISAPLENTVPADPPLHRPKITYVDHQASVPQLLNIFPGLTRQELPDGEGWIADDSPRTARSWIVSVTGKFR